MPIIDLPDDELAAVTAAIRRAIEDDRFPHAPRLDPLRAALARLEAASESKANLAPDQVFYRKLETKGTAVSQSRQAAAAIGGSSMGSMTVGWLVHRVKGDAHEFLGIYQTREKAEADIAVLTGPRSEGWKVQGVPFIGWGQAAPGVFSQNGPPPLKLV